ncbi:MAG: MGDG synthase family glycosyltransferase [Acidimicrobiales bacterium]
MATRVLVVSASMGAGHDGAARELVRRLKAAGHEAEMKDFLTAGPLRIGDLLRSSYEWQMKYMAWSYDLTYRFFFRSPKMCPPLGRVMTRLMSSDLLRWADELDAQVIVSTYPLTSVVLGELRRRGRLQIPTINFITDFGVHPFWIHRNIDLNLTVHSRPAELAQAMSGRPSIATGPMVSSRFDQPQDRAATRAALGLSDDERAVLIVSGSWGVGNVTSTFKTIANSHQFTPIAVCGRDDHLRERLSHIPGGRAMGWTDDMPALMAASDVLVENAGGLTAMEALSVGLPIISFRPIAGHGKENTAEMQAVGVSRAARTKDQLLRLIELVTTPGPTREAMVEAGKAMFIADPARYVEYVAVTGTGGLDDWDALAKLGAPVPGDDEIDIEELACVADGVGFDPAEPLRQMLAMTGLGTTGLAPAASAAVGSVRAGAGAPIEPLPSRGTGADGLEATGTGGGKESRPGRRHHGHRSRHSRPTIWVTRLAGLVAAGALVWAAMTSGVAFATGQGAGVARPASNSGEVAFIGVRLGPSALSDPAILTQLSAMHATAVVDEETAASSPAAVQNLVTLGIDVAGGGAGTRVNAAGHRIDESPWRRADGDVAANHVLTQISGQPVGLFVPGRRLNVFDLVACHDAHAETVVPNHILSPTDDDVAHLSARHIYLVNGADAGNQQVENLLTQLQAQLNLFHLAGAPLSDLV